MKNNDKKKLTELWPHRLFNRSGCSIAGFHNKTYFMRRYGTHQQTAELIPFGNLFTDLDTTAVNLNTETFDLGHIFGEAISHSEINATSLSDDCSSSPKCQSMANVAIPVTVINCYNETQDTKTFRLARLDGEVFDYLPGQYITLSLEILGQEYKRSYSLASTPTHSGNLEITVKRAPNGLVSNWLNDHLKVGDKLSIKGPFGKFTCAKKSDTKVLFLAAGSGIVPIMSMLRWLANREQSVDVVILLSFRTLYDIIYYDELRLLAARHANFKLVITLTQEPSECSQWQGLTGRINEKMLTDQVPDLSVRKVYLCGPDGFMAEARQNLCDLTVPDEQIMCESFSLTTSSKASTHSNTIIRPSRHQSGDYHVHFAKSGETVSANTLLELAEMSGISLSHECRAGSCGECMVKCLKGRVEMSDQAEIDDFDRKKGWVYACCAYPISDVELEV